MAKKTFWLEYEGRTDAPVSISEHGPVMAAKRFMDRYPAESDEIVRLYTEKGFPERKVLLQWTVAELQAKIKDNNAHAWQQLKKDFVKPRPRGSEQVKCPRCGSEQLTANKKGFGFGKGVTGGLIAGHVGLIAGFLGSGKVLVTCLKCGHQWKAGSA